MKDAIKEIISDFHAMPVKKVIARELVIPVNTGKIVTLIGPRRSGKSYYFYHLMHDLLQTGVPKENLLYLNFEDERLNLEAAKLDLILQAYRELYPSLQVENCYLFFDEIQNINGWEKFVRRCNDTITTNIFITGSNANLLSREIATALRGRTLTYEILPLSFREYATFNNSDVLNAGSKSKAGANTLLLQYLMQGGFPEIVLQGQELNTQTLQEYFSVMTYRDMVERYAFSNLPVIKFFLKRVAASTCSYLSLNKLYNELRSQGFKLDKNFLYEVNDASKAIYMHLAIDKFDYSELKRAHSDKKNYFIDNGMLNAITFKFSDDRGRLLENACYLELHRRKKNIFYYKDTKECDFVLYEEERTPIPVQVCYDLSDPDTYSREINGLVHCCKKLKVATGYVLCIDALPDITLNSINIKFISALSFFLGQDEALQ